MLGHALGESERCDLSNCFPLVERAPYVVHQRIEQDPCHSAVPGGDDRPFFKAVNSCSTRTVRRLDGWRPIQTTSGPLLLNGRRPNSTFARQNSENAQYSITAAHPSSSTDAEENLLRAAERRASRAEARRSGAITWSYPADSWRARKEQHKEQDKSCASPGELDRK